MRERASRTGLVAVARRTERYTQGRLRTASASRLTAPKLPDLGIGPGIPENAQLLERIEEARRSHPVLEGAHPSVEVGDPAGPAGGERGYVAHVGLDLVGGAHQRTRRRLLEREEEAPDPGRVVH